VSLIIENTSLPEVKLIKADRFLDHRGFFSEVYKEKDYTALGIPKFVQDNLSESSKGVIRGMHWQESPFAQGKLVTCVRGKILDFAIDIRKESKTRGQFVGIELCEKDNFAIWIPEGFAHGFQALEDNTRINYKVTEYWNPNSEKSINPYSPSLDLNWPIEPSIMSQKDSEAEFLLW